MTFKPRVFVDRLLWIRRYPVFREAPARYSMRALRYTWREQMASRGILEFEACGERHFKSPRNNVSSFIAAVFDERDLNIVRFWRRALRPGFVFVDVGANIGLYAISAGALAGPAGRVLCFEAHPDTHRYLAQNIEQCGAANVTAENLAVGSQAGRVRMAYDGRNSGETHVALSDEPGDPVEMTSLDDYCFANGAAHVDYLKIDVEGFEINVLRGARRLIEANPEILIQTEYEPKHMARYGDPGGLAALLCGWGFVPHGVAWADGQPYALASLKNHRGEILWSRRDLSEMRDAPTPATAARASDAPHLSPAFSAVVRDNGGARGVGQAAVAGRDAP